MFRTRVLFTVLLALGCFTVSSVRLTAADKPIAAHTVVTVDEMCGGCVKKITKRFDSEPSVSSVNCDVPNKTVTIVPAKGASLSPRKMWEILEEVGKVPAKLVGPDGTFTAKPTK
jgi:copper chaperone CopZ